MKTSKKRFLNDVLNIIEEVEELEKKMEIMEVSMNKDQKEENYLNVFLIDYGKKMMYKSIVDITKYESGLSIEYYDGEVSTTFEKWYEILIKKALSRQSSIYGSNGVTFPTSIPLDTTIEMLRPLAKEDYEERRKEAQLEYARSKKEEK